MLKSYIRNIVEREIDGIKLENTLKQLRSEHYLRDKVESEIKYSEFLVNHKNQIIIGLKQENEDLKQENEKLEESIKNLGGTLSLKDNLLNEKNKEIKELKVLYEQEKLEKNKFLFNTYGEKYEIDSLKLENEGLKEENKHLKITLKLSKNKILELKDLYEQEKDKNYKTLESEELKQEIEKLKQENEQLKNLSCTIVVGNDGKLDSLFNQKLKSENEKLKESIENLDGKLILKGNLLSEQKQENEKLKEKMYNIKGIIHVQHKRTYTNDNLMRTIKLIEDIIKES